MLVHWHSGSKPVALQIAQRAYPTGKRNQSNALACCSEIPSPQTSPPPNNDPKRVQKALSEDYMEFSPPAARSGRHLLSCRL